MNSPRAGWNVEIEQKLQKMREAISATDRECRAYSSLLIERIRKSMDDTIWKSRLQIADEIQGKTEKNKYTKAIFTHGNVSNLLIRSVGEGVEIALLSELENDDGADGYKLAEQELSKEHPERKTILPIQIQEVYFYQQWKSGIIKPEQYDSINLPPTELRRALMKDCVLFRFNGNQGLKK